VITWFEVAFEAGVWLSKYLFKEHKVLPFFLVIAALLTTYAHHIYDVAMTMWHRRPRLCASDCARFNLVQTALAVNLYVSPRSGRNARASFWRAQ
jgi:hypothetical protein